MTFNEASTIEALLARALAGPDTVTACGPGLARKKKAVVGVGWHRIDAANLPRQQHEPWVESFVIEALCRLNPEIAAGPDRAEEVLYKLRAIVQSVRADGPIKSNEEFSSWLRGERSMPFGVNHEHVAIRLIDFDNLDNNQYVLTTQYSFRSGAITQRCDLVLLVNGFPLVVIEAKTPVRSSVSWVDGAHQLQRYEADAPELFVSNVFSVASEGKDLRYGSLRLPLKDWGPWRLDEPLAVAGALAGVEAAAKSLLQPATVLDILANFTLFATDSRSRRIKRICRYQQFEATNRIVSRVIAGSPKKGLIWHFQGSGKSLLMVFAAQKLRNCPALKNPTVLVIVDRIDLDTQISGTFHSSDIPNLVKADSREELQKLLKQDTRKIIITTIFKFGEADGMLNDRANIIAMVDEAHRTQEGDLGRKMRAALPNAFLFGLTGTPINKTARNTFTAFGSEEDEHGYLSRYGFEDSIRDGATLPLHFEPRLIDLHIDTATIEEEFSKLTGELSDLERDSLSRQVSRMAVLVKAPQRVERICADIVHHFQEKVEPSGHKAMVVTFDQEACLLAKNEFDKLLPAEASDVVISVTGKKGAEFAEYRKYDRERDAEEKLLERFRDPADPLKILIVTAKLLTGFDAPILQAMYLDKPLRDHTLLQAICRTNRTYADTKTHGLIVDYLGVFDDVAQALQFDDLSVRQAIKNFEELKRKLPGLVQKCLGRFPGVDRSLTGFEGLMAAQECLPTNEARDAFALDFSNLMKIWEALSPDAILDDHEADYRWLAGVYESVQPSTGTGKLYWHALGAKTIELIHRNVRVEAIRDDLETIIVDSALLEEMLGRGDPRKQAREIEIKLADKLRKRSGDPTFRALAERLEDLKDRHEKGLLASVDFLKALLTLAKDTVAAEKGADDKPAGSDAADRGKAALTALFEEVRNQKTPIIVARVVADIDAIVKPVRFDGWQRSSAGERDVKKALRLALFNYKLHSDSELFERAYGYIRQYY